MKELAIAIYIGKQRISPWHAFARNGTSRVEYLLTALTFANIPLASYRQVSFHQLMELDR